MLEEGLLNLEQLESALALQKTEGGFLGRILVKQGYVSQEAVASALVKQCKIPHLNLLEYEIGQDVLALIPEEVCRGYNLLPIDKLGRILTVAMVDPLDLAALQAIREVCPELRIKPILCNWEHYERVLQKVYAPRDDKTGEHTGQRSLTVEGLGFRGPAPAAHKPEAPTPPPVDKVAPTLQAAPAGMDAATLAQAMQSTNATLLAALKEGFDGLGRSLATASPAAGGTMPPEAYAHALRDALRDVMPAMASSGATPTAAALDQNLLARTLQDSVGGAIQEALATVMVKLRAESSAQPSMEQIAQLITTSQADLAERLSDSLRDAVVAQGAQPTSATAPPNAYPPETLAAVIRDSVGGAMQEAMAALMVQMRASSGARSGDGELTQEVVSALRDSQAQLAHSIEHALQSGQTAQAATTQRLEQIAESALQSVQQAALLVEQVNTHENQDGSRLVKRGSLTSVMPFRGHIPEGDSDGKLEADQQVYDTLDSDQPQELFHFNNFISGKANAFTYKIAQAIAAKPGGEYNPFFLYGAVGIGKTHLISAIGNAVNQNTPGVRTGYVSASHFSRRLSEASRANALDAFRENYCCWEILILDDIQVLGGRVEAQEEFFHIFNTLHRAGRQIIIASDKAPDRLGLLEKRLVSRFASGIVSELKSPEWEARVEILRQYAQQHRASVPDEILNLVAMRVPKDIRKMTGSLRKIVAYSELTGQEVSCESANEILSHLGEEQAA